ncbi:mercuric transporter MerT family protein [Shewanella frigidimarina]|uniref:Mercuric transport protein MerT n=1 Tax=Shewanella frigidimarina (strain NCIMB 400) TaxID=318167 RepID=Q07XE5_SHEFN|nr:MULTISPECIES: mercuric transporter MerT family protein [Shewanella]ABI73319.1 Mercuric transport protein MerT [Shewanella frigidimarina NCIMB 400]MBB1364534.1 mercury transporter [Shewanella sp. SR44-4]RPA33870.1 mercury transporter [Shewanella vesiculosa]
MSPKDPNLPIIGGIVAAVGAGLCCAGPFILLLLGVSGSWIGNLTLLEPYRPIFIVVVLALFAVAGRNVYRPMEACDPGTACAVPQVRKRRQVIFWLTALAALVLVTSNYWIVWFA